MFIKIGDGVITDVIKTSSDLTEEQKKKTEKLAKDLLDDKKQAEAKEVN